MLERVCRVISKERKNSRTEYLSSLKEKNLVLYGAGGIGYVTSIILENKGCKVFCFIDDDKAKQGTIVNGLKVVSLHSIGCDAGFLILICVPKFMDIYNRLINLGYKDVQYFPVAMYEKGHYNVSLIKNNLEKIREVYGLLADDISALAFCNILKHRVTLDFSYLDSIISSKQYFPNEIFSLGDNECFVDGGAYNGETIADFINATNNRYKHIYAFEADKQNFEQLIAGTGYVKGECLKLFNSGLYSQTKETGFNSLGNSGSFISETGTERISLVKLDDVVGECKPTYIKLDIEGAETEALYGMKNTITACHPKLAISIYHKAADLWELPILIHTLAPSYKIYIRHYNDDLNETVCYAI